MLALEFAELSDRGRVRDHNEDYLGHFAPPLASQSRSYGWLFVLADGVGGHASGEVASRVAVEAMLQDFRKAPPDEPLASLLVSLVQKANSRVAEAGSDLSTHGMATTLVACGLRHDRATVAHVGDSRCYLVRRGRALQLTEDHTVAAERARLGLISSRQVATSEQKHVLSRAVGLELSVNVDVSEHILEREDRLILCSDGLHGGVEAQQIADITSQFAKPDEAARQLVAAANQNDGSDNISVQVIRIVSVERTGMYRGRPYTLRG